MKFIRKHRVAIVGTLFALVVAVIAIAARYYTYFTVRQSIDMGIAGALLLVMVAIFAHVLREIIAQDIWPATRDAWRKIKGFWSRKPASTDTPN